METNTSGYTSLRARMHVQFSISLIFRQVKTTDPFYVLLQQKTHATITWINNRNYKIDEFRTRNAFEA